MPVIIRPETPRAVAVAVRLLYGGALLPVISTVLEAVRTGVGASAVAITAASFVLDCLIAFFLSRGKNFARVLVFVFAVLALFSFGNYLAFIGAGGDAGRPGWWLPSLVTVDLLQVLTTVGSAVLLLLPAARPYFPPRFPVGAPR